MHWILVYNALFFFDFLFNRIVPNLYISNAGLGTETEKVEKLSPFFFSTPRNSLVIPKFGHDGFARVIDERIVTEMISCYPNVTDPECACCWKFTLR